MKAKNDKLWKKFESHLLNEQLTDKRIKKLKVMYNLVSRHAKKPIDQLDKKGIENYLDDLNRDKIKKQNGEIFSGSTKSDVKKFLKQFFKWSKGKNQIYPKEVSWIKTRIRKEEKPQEKSVVSIQEIVKLSQTFKRTILAIVTLLLFDCGFRIQELLSIKKQDLTWEEYDGIKKCFWIKCNESKTYVRKVPIPLFTEEVKNFCNSAYFRELNDEDLIFNISYDCFRRSLKRKSMKLLKKEVTPHVLRHSSATHYAKEYDGNSMMLAQRYGWSYSSKELATYIRRSGAYQKIGAKKVYDNEVARLKQENREIKATIEVIEKMMKLNGKEMEQLKQMV